MKVCLTLLLGTILGGVLSVGSVLADPVESPHPDMLTVPEAMRLLQSQGFHDFRKIKVERDENEIEVEASDKNGEKVELEIDLYTGKILDLDLD
ncbi:PepSY domain-containing protein [uncultured Photobacterium sp.]|uniref:PepSY domain-containing protein n=1 Tax=uncultured Photobacterium sp. TaxID=173973 RepID=UPI00260A4CE5|nr:PepSY domain-containing protein [uncultured Photobacterium sp.]